MKIGRYQKYKIAIDYSFLKQQHILHMLFYDLCQVESRYLIPWVQNSYSTPTLYLWNRKWFYVT
jgi:hypothetical protein